MIQLERCQSLVFYRALKGALAAVLFTVRPIPLHQNYHVQSPKKIAIPLEHLSVPHSEWHRSLKFLYWLAQPSDL